MKTGPLIIILLFITISYSGYANDRIDSLKLEYEKVAEEEIELTLLLKLANAYVNINTDSTFYYLKLAQEILGEITDKKSIAFYNYSMGHYLHNTYKNDSAISAFQKALALYNELDSHTDILQTNLLIANCYFDILSYDSAIRYYNTVLSLSDSINNPWNYAAYLNNVANVYDRQNNKVNALRFYQRAHDIFLKKESPREIGITKNNIGQIYHEIGELDLSIKYITEAIKINEEINNVDQLLSDYNSITLVYRDLQIYDSAIYYISKAISISKESNFEYSLAQSYHNLGSIYFALEDYKNAEKYFIKSQEICKRLDITIGIIINLIDLGRVYIKYGDYEKSENTFTEALALSRWHKLTDYESSVLNNFNSLYKAWGIYEKALSFYEEYTLLQDSIEELRNRNMLNEIQTKYESEQKELENQRLKTQNQKQEYTIFKQRVLVYFSIAIMLFAALVVIMMYNIRSKRKQRIALLQAKNEKIEEQALELVKSNNTKDKLFSIISHDLRSPFSSLMGFVSLLEQEVENGNFDNLSYYIKQLNTATLNTYELIDNLLNWSRTQQNNLQIQITEVNLHKNVEDIISSMLTIIQEKELNIFNEIPVDYRAKSDTHMLSVIIRNLISNSIKFTQRGGSIYISIHIKEAEFTISIKDNGTGFRDEVRLKLLDKEGGFTTPGTENEAGSGLGLLLVKEFVDKLNGELMIESEPGAGSKFSFSIPVKKF